jgi:hypothetical protein
MNSPFSVFLSRWQGDSYYGTVEAYGMIVLKIFNFEKNYKEVAYSVRHGQYRSRGSSGSIVSDYGLDDRAIGVRSPAGAKDFFL